MHRQTDSLINSTRVGTRVGGLEYLPARLFVSNEYQLPQIRYAGRLASRMGFRASKASRAFPRDRAGPFQPLPVPYQIGNPDFLRSSG
jgi:hypothetical protein